jgi:type VI secretion system protein ImpF
VVDVTRKERLCPPLMHVFRAAHEAKDAKKKATVRTESGERVVTGTRMPVRQAITEPMLRREVSRDLDALLNCVALESTLDLTDLPHARKSILNYGLPDISHRTIDERTVNFIPDELKQAFATYEPRIVAGSVDIERDNSVPTTELKVRFLVRADLVCHPVQVPVEFVADVVDTCKIVINKL